MIPAGHHLWRLSAGGDRNLGLCCTEEGLFLGRTPLIERRGGAYVVRPRADLDRLFGRAYASEATAARVSSGLASVAIALGQGNLALAQITAVHLRLPDLRDTVARAALEAEDLSIKRGSAAWDEARHPRTGTPPNPGWFAPNAGAEARSRPTQTAQGGRGGRRPEATSDPMGEVRQAVWDARIALLRRIDPDNPHLTYSPTQIPRRAKMHSTVSMRRSKPLRSSAWPTRSCRTAGQSGAPAAVRMSENFLEVSKRPRIYSIISPWAENASTIPTWTEC